MTTTFAIILRIHRYADLSADEILNGISPPYTDTILFESPNYNEVYLTFNEIIKGTSNYFCSYLKDVANKIDCPLEVSIVRLSQVNKFQEVSI